MATVEPILFTDAEWRQFRGEAGRTYYSGHWRILNARPRVTAFGVNPISRPITADELIPRDQWDDLIAQKDAEGSWLEDLVRAEQARIGKTTCKDQDGLGFCWIYGPTTAAEAERIRQGHPYVELSPESAGGPLVNWRNSGGDPEQGLQALMDNGACPESYLDGANSLSPHRWKSGWQTAAQNFRVTMWRDLMLAGKVFDALATAAFRNRCGCLGFTWWGHEISGPYRISKKNGIYFARDRNNWGASFGDDGFFDLPEGNGSNQGTPDINLDAVDQVVPYDGG